MPLLTFVSNHDVIRLASVLKKREHYTLAMAALLLLPGIPCFYYGDEFGVEVRVSGSRFGVFGLWVSVFVLLAGISAMIERT